ncbi:MAG TPA: IS200/IS605 family transposase [Gemmataceae bacterium]|jgi:REP element-mobilizing transposase RayT|nr:IS200/IS605 family transposase [Gemmataceae bacterium]
MAHSYTNLLVHIVFGTKNREPRLQKPILERVLPFIASGIKDHGGIPLELNGVADHVHILAKVRQDRALSDLLRDIKACSSGWIHKNIPELQSFAWQAGYGAFSIGQSQIEAVRRYIQNQEEHHRTQTFQEEYIGFLELAGIEYDLRYLWD